MALGLSNGHITNHFKFVCIVGLFCRTVVLSAANFRTLRIKKSFDYKLLGYKGRLGS